MTNQKVRFTNFVKIKVSFRSDLKKQNRATAASCEETEQYIRRL